MRFLQEMAELSVLFPQHNRDRSSSRSGLWLRRVSGPSFGFRSTTNGEQGAAFPSPIRDHLVPVTEEYQAYSSIPTMPVAPCPSAALSSLAAKMISCSSQMRRPTLEHVLILIGQRRSGKTSLLKQLPVKLNKRYVPVFIDIQGLTSDPGMAKLLQRLKPVDCVISVDSRD